MSLKAEKTPFAIAAAGWLVLGAALTHSSAPTLKWFALLSLLCLADLLAMSKCLEAALSRIVVQALFWGFVKMACLGLIGLALFRGQSIPSMALLLGVGTLVIVPLFGGFWWSKRSLEYA